MPVPGPEGIDTRHLDVAIESQIEELRRLGLPYDFATGLLEITDNAEGGFEQLAILAGVQLFRDAYQVSQGQDPRRASMHAVPAPDYDTGGSESTGSPQDRSSQVADFIAKLVGKDRAKSFDTVEAAVGLVRGLLQADYANREAENVNKPRPEFAHALELFVAGLSLRDIESRLDMSVTSFYSNKKTFIKRVVQKGLAEQVLARIEAESSTEHAENTGVAEAGPDRDAGNPESREGLPELGSSVGFVRELVNSQRSVPETRPGPEKSAEAGSTQEETDSDIPHGFPRHDPAKRQA